jgi:hypothetical protein
MEAMATTLLVLLQKFGESAAMTKLMTLNLDTGSVFSSLKELVQMMVNVFLKHGVCEGLGGGFAANSGSVGGGLASLGRVHGGSTPGGTDGEGARRHSRRGVFESKHGRSETDAAGGHVTHTRRRQGYNFRGTMYLAILHILLRCRRLGQTRNQNGEKVFNQVGEVLQRTLSDLHHGSLEGLVAELCQDTLQLTASSLVGHAGQSKAEWVASVAFSLFEQLVSVTDLGKLVFQLVQKNSWLAQLLEMLGGLLTESFGDGQPLGVGPVGEGVQPHPHTSYILTFNQACARYDAICALLIRVAASPEGAQMLVDSGIVSQLKHCTAFSERPFTSINGPSWSRKKSTGEGEGALGGDRIIGSRSKEDTINTATEYHQVLMPALNLISALMCTLRPTTVYHKRLAEQVAEFIQQHYKALAKPLWSLVQNEHNDISISELQQMSVFSSILAKLAAAPAQYDGKLDGKKIGPLSTKIQELMMRALAVLGKSVVPLFLAKGTCAPSSTPAARADQRPQFDGFDSYGKSPLNESQRANGMNGHSTDTSQTPLWWNRVKPTLKEEVQMAGTPWNPQSEEATNDSSYPKWGNAEGGGNARNSNLAMVMGENGGYSSRDNHRQGPLSNPFHVVKQGLDQMQRTLLQETEAQTPILQGLLHHVDEDLKDSVSANVHSHTPSSNHSHGCQDWSQFDGEKLAYGLQLFNNAIDFCRARTYNLVETGTPSPAYTGAPTPELPLRKVFPVIEEATDLQDDVPTLHTVFNALLHTVLVAPLFHDEYSPHEVFEGAPGQRQHVQKVVVGKLEWPEARHGPGKVFFHWLRDEGIKTWYPLSPPPPFLPSSTLL